MQMQFLEKNPEKKISGRMRSYFCGKRSAAVAGFLEKKFYYFFVSVSFVKNSSFFDNYFLGRISADVMEVVKLSSRIDVSPEFFFCI